MSDEALIRGSENLGRHPAPGKAEEVEPARPAVASSSSGPPRRVSRADFRLAYLIDKDGSDLGLVVVEGDDEHARLVGFVKSERSE